MSTRFSLRVSLFRSVRISDTSLLTYTGILLDHMLAESFVRIELALAEAIGWCHPVAQKKRKVSDLIVTLGATKQVDLLGVELKMHLVQKSAGQAEANRGDRMEVLKDHFVNFCGEIVIWIFFCDLS